MLRFTLTLKRIDHNTLALVFPVRVRAVFLAVAVILAASMTAVGEFAAVPFIFIVISLLSAGYTEAWYFSAETGLVRRQIGIYPVLRTKILKIEEVGHFEIVRFTRGRLSTTAEPEDERRKRIFETDFTALRMVTRSGDSLDIETVKSNRSGVLIEAAEEIAALCRVPLGRKD